jgi:hypothetical protein
MTWRLDTFNVWLTDEDDRLRFSIHSCNDQTQWQFTADSKRQVPDHPARSVWLDRNGELDALVLGAALGEPQALIDYLMERTQSGEFYEELEALCATELRP